MTRDEIEAARKHLGACVTKIEGGFVLGHEDAARLIADGAAMARDCDAWRTVTGADTPEALAAELDACRARVGHSRADDADLGGTTAHPRTTP